MPPERVLADPPPGTAIEADLLDEAITRGRGVELVDGILVEKPIGARDEHIAMWIGHLILAFAVERQLGTVYGSQGGMRFRVGLVRMPDVSFFRWDSVDNPDDLEDPDGAFVEVPPDLAVEVLSPGNTPKEMAIKLGEYAAAGVNLVWYVDPDRKEVTVYPKGKERGKKVLGLDEVLDGGTVLPGFTLPVATIFAKRAPAKKPGRKGKK
ncbi:MAG: Uma2 family endonuclease [Gemmataceae bacterium]